MRQTCRRTRRFALLATTCLLLAACSVDTPRGGSTLGQAVQPGLQGQPGQGSTEGSQVGSGGTTATTTGGTTGGSGSSGLATAGSGATGGTGTTGTSGSTSTSGATTGTSGTTSAGGTSVGVSKDTIKLGFSADFEGIYQAFFTDYFEDGVKVWEADVNARGGINGRKVSVAKINSRGTASGGLEACQQILRQGLFMTFSVLGLFGADVNQANCLNRAGVPHYIEQPSTVNPSWKTITTGFQAAGYSAPSAGFIKRVIKDTPPVGKSKIQVGVLYATDTLNKAKHTAFVAAAKAEGMDVVAEETYEPGTQTMSAQAQRLQQSGATTVAFFGGIEYLTAFREATAIGYRPKWTGTDIGADEGPTICYACYEGMQTYRWWATTDAPAYKAFVRVSQGQGGHDNTSTLTAGYYGVSLLIEQVLRRLGTNPVREKVAPTFQGLGNYHNGLMGGTFAAGRIYAEPDLFPVACCHSAADRTFRPLGPARRSF